MQETQVHFLGREDPQEKGMVTYSTMGHKESDKTK